MVLGFVSNKKEKLYQEILSQIGNIEEEDLVYLPELLQEIENARTSSELTMITQTTHLLKKTQTYTTAGTTQKNLFRTENVVEFVKNGHGEADLSLLENENYDCHNDGDELRGNLITVQLEFCKEITDLFYWIVVRQTIVSYYAKFLLDEHRNLKEENEFLAKRVQEYRNEAIKLGKPIGVGEKLISSVPIKPMGVDLDRVNKSNKGEDDVEESLETTDLSDSSEFKENEDLTQNVGQDEDEIEFPEEKPKTEHKVEPKTEEEKQVEEETEIITSTLPVTEYESPVEEIIDPETEELEKEIQTENHTTENKLPEKEIRLPSQVIAERKAKDRDLPPEFRKITIQECFGSMEEFNKRMVGYLKILFDERPQWSSEDIFERLAIAEPKYFADKAPKRLHIQMLWVLRFMSKKHEYPYVYKITERTALGGRIWGRILKTEKPVEEDLGE